MGASSQGGKRHATVRDAKRICKDLGQRGVIVLSIDDSYRVAVASYGATVADCRMLAVTVDQIFDALGWGNPAARDAEART